MRDCENCSRNMNCLDYEIADDTALQAKTCREYLPGTTEELQKETAD